MSVDGHDYWRCPRCLVTFLDPRQRLALADEHDHYRLHRNDPDDPRYRRFLQPLATQLLQRLPLASHGLDFGCGPGSALAAMLREAGQRVALYDPLFAENPAALQCQYDFIACSEVVEHLHQPAAVFAQFNQMLKPGAWLGIMTGLLSDDGAFARWHYRRDPTHVVFYRGTTFAHLARRYAWRCELPCANVVMLQKGMA